MRLICSLLLSLCLLPLVAAAEVYKYTDEKGVVHYSDNPPTKGARPVVLPPLHTYPALDTPKRDKATAPAGAPPLAVSIVSPAPDQIYRDPTAEIAVSANVTPALPEGYALVYYVDGAAATAEPVSSTGFSVAGLERGQHSLAVAVVNGEGKEVARSASINVHMKPPTVKPTVIPRK